MRDNEQSCLTLTLLISLSFFILISVKKKAKLHQLWFHVTKEENMISPARVTTILKHFGTIKKKKKKNDDSGHKSIWRSGERLTLKCYRCLKLLQHRVLFVVLSCIFPNWISCPEKSLFLQPLIQMDSLSADFISLFFFLFLFFFPCEGAAQPHSEKQIQ